MKDTNEKSYELNPSVGCEMPRYKCHKEVHALCHPADNAGGAHDNQSKKL